MKVEQLSDLALDCIHSAARALDARYWPAFYGEVAKGLETLDTDALFVIRKLVASAQRQVLTGLATSSSPGSAPAAFSGRLAFSPGEPGSAVSIARLQEHS
jgi:hypothetical protein